MSQDPDDKFLDVLAGRRAADDLDTRRAARLRSYFLRHPSLAEQPRNDPEGEARLLAYLQARRAAGPLGAPSQAQPAPAPAAQAQPGGGLLQRLGGWLFPPGAGFGARQAGLALGVMGLGVAVLLALQQEPEVDTGMKGAPAGVKPPLAGQPVPMFVPDPAAAAAELQALLMTAAVPSTLEPQPDGSLLLKATVPPQAVADLLPRLQAEGVNLPPDGQLKLRLARLP